MSYSWVQCIPTFTFFCFQKKQPYVYQWNMGNAQDGYSEGFQMAFDGYFGLLDQANCLLWASMDDFCLQCFNGASRPEKVSAVCLSGSFGQYEVELMTKKDSEEA